MKKIMFNDRYGLTKAVLEGRKTMTRRIIPPIVIDWNRRGKVTLPVSCFKGETLFMDASAILDRVFEYPAPAKYQPKFEAGEIVAVAQRYKDIRDIIGDIQDGKSIKFMAGWNNKMFVRADLMPHQIRFTNVSAERLQDISDKDCVKEGIYVSETEPFVPNGYSPHCANDPKEPKKWFHTPREAFAALIDKVSGKVTWKSNPWVFVYEFELVK